jgi:hypothetical protein
MIAAEFGGKFSFEKSFLLIIARISLLLGPAMGGSMIDKRELAKHALLTLDRQHAKFMSHVSHLGTEVLLLDGFSHMADGVERRCTASDAIIAWRG